MDKQFGFSGRVLRKRTRGEKIEEKVGTGKSCTSCWVVPSNFIKMCIILRAVFRGEMIQSQQETHQAMLYKVNTVYHSVSKKKHTVVLGLITTEPQDKKNWVLNRKTGVPPKSLAPGFHWLCQTHFCFSSSNYVPSSCIRVSENPLDLPGSQQLPS